VFHAGWPAGAGRDGTRMPRTARAMSGVVVMMRSPGRDSVKGSDDRHGFARGGEPV
jgi:hypothetical protein